MTGAHDPIAEDAVDALAARLEVYLERLLDAGQELDEEHRDDLAALGAQDHHAAVTALLVEVAARNGVLLGEVPGADEGRLLEAARRQLIAVESMRQAARERAGRKTAGVLSRHVQSAVVQIDAAMRVRQDEQQHRARKAGGA